jgi:hypothetical protein
VASPFYRTVSGRGERVGAGERFQRLDFRFLFFFPENSGKQSFSHDDDPLIFG